MAANVRHHFAQHLRFDGQDDNVTFFSSFRVVTGDLDAVLGLQLLGPVSARVGADDLFGVD